MKIGMLKRNCEDIFSCTFLFLKVDENLYTPNLIFILMKHTIFYWKQMTSRINKGSINYRIYGYQRIDCSLNANDIGALTILLLLLGSLLFLLMLCLQSLSNNHNPIFPRSLYIKLYYYRISDFSGIYMLRFSWNLCSKVFWNNYPGIIKCILG